MPVPQGPTLLELFRMALIPHSFLYFFFISFTTTYNTYNLLYSRVLHDKNYWERIFKSAIDGFFLDGKMEWDIPFNSWMTWIFFVCLFLFFYFLSLYGLIIYLRRKRVLLLRLCVTLNRLLVYATSGSRETDTFDWNYTYIQSSICYLCVFLNEY